MRRYLGMGYGTVKMKIGGGSIDEDRRRIEAVLEVVGDGQALAVDANGRYDLKTAIAYAEMLRSEEHTSELQSLMRISYAVFCLKKKTEHALLHHCPSSY